MAPRELTFRFLQEIRAGTKRAHWALIYVFYFTFIGKYGNKLFNIVNLLIIINVRKYFLESFKPICTNW